MTFLFVFSIHLDYGDVEHVDIEIQSDDEAWASCEARKQAKAHRDQNFPNRALTLDGIEAW